MSLTAVILGFVLAHPSFCLTKHEAIQTAYPIRVLYLVHRDRCPFIAQAAAIPGYLEAWRKAEAPPAPPKRFTIHGQEWRILQVQRIKEGDDYKSMTYCGEHVIRIRSDIARAYDVAESLVHELMHSLTCHDGEMHDAAWNNTNDLDDGCDGHCGIYNMRRGQRLCPSR